MVVTSLAFWVFLAVVLAVFAALGPRGRLVWLIAASLAYAAGFGWVDLAGLTLVVALTAGCLAVRGHWRAPALWTGAAVLVAALVAVKAGALQVLGLPVPVGFSFYSFTAIACLVDARRDPATRWQISPVALGLAWFPKLLAGPILRLQDIAPMLGKRPLITPERLQTGAVLILGGLLKKLVIADNLGPVVDAAYAIPAYAAPMELLIATYFFAFQIYCDFSGYTDLALGLSLLFGLRLPVNFFKPYLSSGIGQFWSSRWHITLGRWFRDYVYIPLGGSRAGPLRRSANLITVFALSGLWHSGMGYGAGWGFLVWGLLNGAFVSTEALLPKAGKGRLMTVARTVLTFHLVLVSWVFFRASGVSDALTVLRRIAVALPDLPRLVPTYPFTIAHATGAALIVGLLVTEIVTGAAPVHQRVLGLPRPLRWGVIYLGMALVLLLGRWQGSSFIYQQF